MSRLASASSIFPINPVKINLSSKLYCLTFSFSSSAIWFSLGFDPPIIKNFTLGITGTNEALSPTGVEIQLRSAGGLSDFIMNVSIQEVNATGFPDIVEEGGSGMIAFGQVNVTDITAVADGEMVNCSLTSYGTLQPDTEYFIVIMSDVSQAGSVYVETDFNDGTYAGGQLAYRDVASGAWTEDANDDWEFYVYGSTPQDLYTEKWTDPFQLMLFFTVLCTEKPI